MRIAFRLVVACRPTLYSRNFSSLKIPDQQEKFGKNEKNESLTTSVLRRALLYVPGNDQRKIDKALSKLDQIDTIVLDCEDGVAINRKIEARETIFKTLNQNFSETSFLSRIAVRINSMDSGLAQDDLEVILSGKNLPRTILLPKVDSQVDIDHFSDKFAKAMQNRNKQKFSESKNEKSPSIDLITYVESAKGLLDLRRICQHAIEMTEYTNFHLAGVVFGSDDFCANIGAQRSEEANEVLYARQHVIVVTKSFDLQAIDVVFINFKDLEALKRQSEQGAFFGFTGKQAIHPDQIPIIQEAFRPSDAKIIWAKGLVKAFEQAQKEGKGAFVYNGQMIDMPLLKQAYHLLSIVKQIQ